MKDLDLQQLRALRTLIAERSVTRAADRLGVSQPAMSTMLRRLREHFGDPILTRAPGGSAPTQHAAVLLDAVNEILDRVDRLKGARFDRQRLREVRARVSITATDYVQQLVLPALLTRLAADTPGLTLDVRLANKVQLRHWMERGEVDLGIGPAIVPTGRMHFRPVRRDRAVTIMSAGLAARARRLTLERFCELDHIRIAPNSPHSSEGAFYDDAIERELDRRKLKRNVALTMQHFLSVQRIVAECEVVATVPSRLIRTPPDAEPVVAREPPIPLPEMVIGMFWHERTHHDGFQRWFRDLVRGVLQQA